MGATHQRGLPRLLGGGGVSNSDGRGYGLSSQETFFVVSGQVRIHPKLMMFKPSLKGNLRVPRTLGYPRMTSFLLVANQLTDKSNAGDLT